ncbi:hypothetical protein NBG4_80043 [Candidatus Sulfobium mesophilum]|uniref:Uncharacterized protein n=1 Tax=Candidatus Sulfobium mesophilum TaxID=2016548 RepID=A0A2U3QKK6_9BACT|nr:hypothetical protein NBG4_80043 [Candidatus Sulfobium mesophilum]
MRFWLWAITMPERGLLCEIPGGSGWGMKGYFTMPYDYLSDRDLSDDFWTIRAGELMIKK